MKRIAVVVSLLLTVIGTGAVAAPFEIERYTQLDEAVQAADGIVADNEKGSATWRTAAMLAVATRTDLWNYIVETIDDPSLDNATRDAIAQVLATMAIDATNFSVDLGDCGLALWWMESAERMAHPALERELDITRANAAVCRPAPVVVVPEPSLPATPPPATIAPPPTRPQRDRGPSASTDTGSEATRSQVAAATVEPAPAARSSGRSAGWALVATGAALALGGVAIDVAGSSDRQTAERLRCDQLACYDPVALAEFVAATDREDKRLVPGLVLYAAGAVGGATGIALVARRGRDRDVAMRLVPIGRGVAVRAAW